jgi:hypothetical protein
MTEKALNDLKTILDHMGPNMSLHMDEVALERCFGSSIDVLAAAEELAKPDCSFARDQTGLRKGRFTRAHPKGAGEGT